MIYALKRRITSCHRQFIPRWTLFLLSPARRHRRPAYLAAEFLVTACLSSAILFTILHVLGLADESSNPATPLAPRRPARHLVCTLSVYAGVENAAALLRILRTGTASEPDGGPTHPYRGMRVLEAGWREPFAIVKMTNACGSMYSPGMLTQFAKAPVQATHSNFVLDFHLAEQELPAHMRNDMPTDYVKGARIKRSFNLPAQTLPTELAPFYAHKVRLILFALEFWRYPVLVAEYRFASYSFLV
ncbi:hypothetical protein DFH09DRAFT_1336953 [Mycena vulgaris]|nr:hypothetical protein DFH09DRAFT_1336953 [Mycena vulgaris]